VGALCTGRGGTALRRRCCGDRGHRRRDEVRAHGAFADAPTATASSRSASARSPRSATRGHRRDAARCRFRFRFRARLSHKSAASGPSDTRPVSRRLICLGAFPEAVRTPHLGSRLRTGEPRRTYATASRGSATAGATCCCAGWNGTASWTASLRSGLSSNAIVGVAAPRTAAVASMQQRGNARSAGRARRSALKRAHGRGPRQSRQPA
jgi:hypothetical protein